MGADKPTKGASGSTMQLAGLGAELAGAVLVFCLIGYWIDRHWPRLSPWGLVICSVLGIVGGLYNLVRKAVHESLGIKPPGPGPSGSDDGSADPGAGRP